MLLPYVLHCIRFERTSEFVCRTSENCKALVLRDKCNIFVRDSVPCQIMRDRGTGNIHF